MSLAPRIRRSALSPRQERFAVSLASGLPAAQAYNAAGFRPHRSGASRLSTNVNVQRRVADLQQRAAARADVTIDSLVVELETSRQIAMARGQYAAAVAAIMAKAKLLGLLGVAQRPTLMEIAAADIEALDDEHFGILTAAMPVLRRLGIVPSADGPGSSFVSSTPARETGTR